jgi:hypothetical protein
VHRSCKYSITCNNGENCCRPTTIQFTLLVYRIDPRPHFDPLRLVINFIVPWGDFQAYLIRADADDNEDAGGPFISRHINRPSERSWRAFMEGSTVGSLLYVSMRSYYPP